MSQAMRWSTTWRTGAAGLVLVALAVGCSDSGGGADAGGGPSTTAASGPGAPATRVIESKADGFSIEIPSGWKDVVIDPDTLQRFLEASGGKLDEAVANQVRTIAGRGGKLFAYDVSKRTTNLNVLKVPSSPGVTTEQVAQSLPAQLEQLGLTDVKVEMVTIAAGPAVKASGVQKVEAGGKSVELLQLQYYVVVGPSTFIAILATDDPARDRGALEAIGQSFKLLS